MGNTTYAQIVAYIDGRAICQNQDGELLYIEAPEELVVIGETLPSDTLRSVFELDSEAVLKIGRMLCKPKEIMNFGIVIHYMDGMAICEDVWGELFYLEIPEEYAALGDAVDFEDLTPIAMLGDERETAVRAAVAAIPEDLHRWALEMRVC